jgi:hypothetical protein
MVVSVVAVILPMAVVFVDDLLWVVSMISVTNRLGFVATKK